MKHSIIGKYGYRLIPVEGYMNKKGKMVVPYWKKVRFEWNNT